MEETAAPLHGKELIRVRFQGRERNLVVLHPGESTGIFETHEKVEAFNRSHGTRLGVVPHDLADYALNTGATWKQLASCHGFAVDTAIATVDARLGDEIVLSLPGEPKVVMATGRYKGEWDLALAAPGVSARDIRKEGDTIRLDITDDRLIPVPRYPAESGWYLPHKPTGVPQGKDVGEQKDSRYLDKSGRSYVGLIVRHVCADGCNYRQYVTVHSKASWKYAVVAEVPEPDVETIQALIDSRSQTRSG